MPVTTPLLDELDEGVGEQLGVHAEIAVLPQSSQQRIGDRPDAGLDRGAVWDALGDQRRDALVHIGGLGQRHLDERPVDLGPPRHLADVHLVAPEGAGHAGVDLEEERHPTDEWGDVVTVRTEREVAVAVHRRRCGQDHRALRRLPQQAGHLAEVVGNQLAASRVERRPRDR